LAKNFRFQSINQLINQTNKQFVDGQAVLGPPALENLIEEVVSLFDNFNDCIVIIFQTAGISSA